MLNLQSLGGSQSGSIRMDCRIYRLAESIVQHWKVRDYKCFDILTSVQPSHNIGCSLRDRDCVPHSRSDDDRTTCHPMCKTTLLASVHRKLQGITLRQPAACPQSSWWADHRNEFCCHRRPHLLMSLEHTPTCYIPLRTGFKPSWWPLRGELDPIKQNMEVWLLFITSP